MNMIVDMINSNYRLSSLLCNVDYQYNYVLNISY